MILEGFLIGVIVCCSAVAALYFLRFWKRTRDALFLAFALSFFIEGVNRARFLFLDSPNEGSASIYMVRLIAYLLILAAILYKNLPARR